MNQREQFESQSLPRGSFEQALENSSKNLLENTRMDYILQQGHASGKSSLIKAYLLNKKNPSKHSDLVLKAIGLEGKETDKLLESRLLLGKLPTLEKDQRDQIYSQSLLAGILEHPYLNSNLVLEMGEEQRQRELKELEEFYGVPISEILAFIEFKMAIKDIEKFKLEGKKQVNEIPLEEEYNQEDLQQYETNLLNKFFSFKTPNSKAETQTYLESPTIDKDAWAEHLEKLDSSKITNTKGLSIPTDSRPINQSAEQRSKEYAYYFPLHYKDTEAEKMYGNQRRTPINIQKQNMVFPREFEPNTISRIQLPEIYEQDLEEMTFRDLIQKVKSEKLTDGERRDILAALYKKQDKEELWEKTRDIKLLSTDRKEWRRRNDNWIPQEMVKERVSKESTGNIGVNLMQNKGAFTQLDRYESGLALPEQSVLGVLHFDAFKDKRTLAQTLNDNKFKKNLKRAVVEYLGDLSLTMTNKRKEVFLGIEKSLKKGQLPDLKPEQFLALIIHPFSFDFLHVLVSPTLMAKFRTESADLLQDFLQFLNSLPDEKIEYYMSFFDMFWPSQFNQQNFEGLKKLYFDCSLKKGLENSNTFYISKIILVLQMLNNQPWESQYLKTLGSIHLIDDITTTQVISQGNYLKEIIASEALTLFYSDLMIRADSVETARLIILSKFVLEDLEADRSVLALLCKFTSTLQLATLEEVFGNKLVQVLTAMHKHRESDMLKRDLILLKENMTKAVESSDHKLDISLNTFFDKEESLNKTFKHILNEDTQILISAQSAYSVYNSSYLLETNNSEFETYKNLIQGSPVDQQIVEYKNLVNIFERRTGNVLSQIYDSKRELDQDVLAKNYQILWDFYNLNLKDKVSNKDFTDNQQLRTASWKHKSGRGKGLNFSNRTMRYYYSQVTHFRFYIVN